MRGLVEDLEVRFLGNHDPNIHFALVSDLPDSASSRHAKTVRSSSLCSSLIGELNEKYAGQHDGIVSSCSTVTASTTRARKRWMGWERKRGKLLDLNRLLRGHYDSFPVKVGDLSYSAQRRAS